MSHGRGRLASPVPWLIPLVVVSTLLGGCHARPDASPSPSTAAAGKRQPPPIRFAGAEPTKTDPFLLAGGLTVFTAVHREQGGFKVEVLNKDGRPQRVLFLANGRYRGSTGLGLPGGIYRLTVAAGTPWRVEITQPRGRAGAALPQRYSGVEDALVGPFRVNGNLQVDVEHDGPGDVTVELLSDQGPSLYFLVEESGNFQTSRTAAGLEAGNYYLNIEASPAWRLDLH
jgi:hypothetical protein